MPTALPKAVKIMYHDSPETLEFKLCRRLNRLEPGFDFLVIGGFAGA